MYAIFVWYMLTIFLCVSLCSSMIFNINGVQKNVIKWSTLVKVCDQHKELVPKPQDQWRTEFSCHDFHYKPSKTVLVKYWNVNKRLLTNKKDLQVFVCYIVHNLRTDSWSTTAVKSIVYYYWCRTQSQIPDNNF